jgi:uncharacterized sporulation protein YeaH/YhbH (DUF444 family)
MVADSSRGDLQVREKAEEARFEAYAKERRAQLEKTKRGYAEQLEGFERERIRMLASDEKVVGRGKRKVVEVRGLEKVSLEEGGEGLDDFFGGGGREEAEEEEVAKPKEAKGKGRGKGKGKTTTPPPAKRKVNPAIMVDEDIDDDEEMMNLYRR